MESEEQGGEILQASAFDEYGKKPDFQGRYSGLSQCRWCKSYFFYF